MSQWSTHILQDYVRVGVEECARNAQKSHVFVGLVLYCDDQRIFLSVHDIYDDTDELGITQKY